MRRALLASLALGACGARGGTNSMIEQRSKLADVHAPHVAIFVHAEDGLYKVFLDTGQSEQITTERNTFVLDATTFGMVDKDSHYVIVRNGERKVLDAVEAPNGYPTIAPNGKLLAHATSGDAEIVTIDVDTGEAHHYPIPGQGPQRQYLSLTFTPQSDAIVFSQNGYFKVDLASAAITPVDKLDFEIAGKRPEPTDCPTRGMRLEERSHKGKQEIVMIPTASAADPEHLSGTESRVLVRATNKDQPHGDGAITMMWKHPGPLSAELFTPDCGHFVFALEGSVYVGNVDTGAYARVAHGTSATLR